MKIERGILARKTATSYKRREIFMSPQSRQKPEPVSFLHPYQRRLNQKNDQYKNLFMCSSLQKKPETQNDEQTSETRTSKFTRFDQAEMEYLKTLKDRMQPTKNGEIEALSSYEKIAKL